MSAHTHPPNDVADLSSTLPGLEPLLSGDALAEYVGVPVVATYRWRTEGKQPCAVRIRPALALGGGSRSALSCDLRE